MNLNEKKAVMILSPSLSHPLTEYTRVVLVDKSSTRATRIVRNLEYSEEIDVLIDEGLAEVISVSSLLNFYINNRNTED